MRKALILGAFALLVAPLAVQASSLGTVSGAAALEGSYGLPVTINNDGTNAYVSTDTPDGESTYRARFLIDLNDTFTQATANTNGNNFFTLAQADGDYNGTPPPVYAPTFRLYVMNRTVAPYCRARLGVYSNINQRILAPPVGIDCNGTVELTIEWQAGASSTGIARLTSVSPVIGTRVGERTDVSNHTLNVQLFRFGHAAGTPPQTISGTFYLDSFESYRTLAP